MKANELDSEESAKGSMEVSRFTEGMHRWLLMLILEAKKEWWLNLAYENHKYQSTFFSEEESSIPLTMKLKIFYSILNVTFF